MKDYQFLQQKFVVNTYPDRQVCFVSGDGVFLIDDENQRYIDFMSNYGVNIFGYSHQEITKALIEQIQNLTTIHGSFNNNVRALASEALIKRCGENYSQVYW